MTPARFEEIGQVICAWLDYQIGCGRESLLGEHYLSLPIGEYLLAHYSGGLVSEFSHPKFSNTQRGRPRQIDYALFTRDHRRLEYAVEAKWAGTGGSQKQAIVNDLMRLEALRPVIQETAEERRGTVHRYFILAGPKNTVTTLLNQRLNGTGRNPPPDFLREFMPYEERVSKNIALRDIDSSWRRFFSSFSKSYGVLLPLTFRIELKVSATGISSKVMVWKISSVPRRTEFDPEREWAGAIVPETEENEDDD